MVEASPGLEDNTYDCWVLLGALSNVPSGADPPVPAGAWPRLGSYRSPPIPPSPESAAPLQPHYQHLFRYRTECCGLPGLRFDFRSTFANDTIRPLPDRYSKGESRLAPAPTSRIIHYLLR